LLVLVLLEHPVYGGEAETICTDLTKRGPALGILLWLATQRPDPKSIPTGISANAVLRCSPPASQKGGAPLAYAQCVTSDRRLPHDLHRQHTAPPYRPAITKSWPERQAMDVIEVIEMTTSVARWARTLRNLYKEQACTWERFFRAGLPPQPGAQDSAARPRVRVPAPRPAVNS
jgi:hypothetical protein